MSIPVSAAALAAGSLLAPPESAVLGIYRFLLASLVVQSHLWPYLADWTGYYSVFAFYLLSGYLMTFVLSEVYGTGFDGRVRFLANRVLRLYPAYALAVAAGALAAATASPEALAMNRALRFPSSPLGWPSQILLFGPSRESLRLVPTA